MPKAPYLSLLALPLVLAACAAPSAPGGQGPGTAPAAADPDDAGNPPPAGGSAPVATLARTERELGPAHPGVARALDRLADAYEAEGRRDQAEPLRRRALAIREAAYGPNHPEVATSLAPLARSYAAQGRLEEAMDTIRRAAAVRRIRVVTEAGLGIGGAAEGGARQRDAAPAGQVAIGWRLLERTTGPSSRARLLDETFRAAQLLHDNDVGAAVARVAARIAVGEDALAGVVRRWLTLIERRHDLDRALVEAADRPPAERSRFAEARLRRSLEDTIARLGDLNRRIGFRFPEYKELTHPVPAGVEEVQALLAPDEALLAYAVLGEGDGEEAFLWLLRRDRAEMARLDLAPGELEAAVRELRGQLDPGRWTGPSPPRFDAALAHRLHRKLLPVDPALLAGADHLLVVPSGPLQSLPFAVLARAEPPSGAGYREVDWLARHHATTTLPSVTSLRVLRRLGGPSRAAAPFRGVGDPVLTGVAAPARGASAAALLADGLADPAQVRALPPLPETDDELRALARDLRAGEGSLLLGERATEQAVKGGALEGARVVAFATHAGVAGELPGIAEPALVLTPPEVASEEDDGVLSASEAARLRLDAEFVVLSACNTAAPDGSPGAPGLSGLAKAFLYAGGRSLLVSHWAVLSDAAERLTTGVFAALAREPGLGRSEALRRSAMALLDGAGDPLLAHPAAWAPFVIVGEGRAPLGAAAAAQASAAAR